MPTFFRFLARGCTGTRWPTRGCNSCAQEVWDALSGGKPSEYSCGGHISYQYLMGAPENRSKIDACLKVSVIEFPTISICGGCSPDLCDGKSFSDHSWMPLPFTTKAYNPLDPSSDCGSRFTVLFPSHWYNKESVLKVFRLPAASNVIQAIPSMSRKACVDLEPINFPNIPSLFWKREGELTMEFSFNSLCQ